MRRTIATVLAIGFASLPASAQSAPVAPPSGQKTLAATMGVYVFPGGGQSSEQQSKDETECYNWAVGNVGTDPFELAKQSEAQQAQTEQAVQQAQQAGKGAGASGAVKGAAAGALIGEIANDDAGEGAAYGAAAGVVAGRRRAKSAQKGATQQAQAQGQQAQQATQEQLLSFKKAFSACLEGKKYTVKY